VSVCCPQSDGSVSAIPANCKQLANALKESSPEPSLEEDSTDVAAPGDPCANVEVPGQSLTANNQVVSTLCPVLTVRHILILIE
jgi:hypothetical protein